MLEIEDILKPQAAGEVASPSYGVVIPTHGFRTVKPLGKREASTNCYFEILHYTDRMKVSYISQIDLPQSFVELMDDQDKWRDVERWNAARGKGEFAGSTSAGSHD